MRAGLMAASCAGLVLAAAGGLARRWPALGGPRTRKPSGGPPPGAQPSSPPRLLGGPALVGRVLRRGAGRPADSAGDIRLGGAVIVAVAVALVVPPLGPLAGAVAWAVPALRCRRQVRRRTAELRRTLPEVVDLLSVAIGSGLTVGLAAAAVARRAPGPLAAELGRAVADAAAGRRLADALDDAGARAGEAARPVIAALVASERYGAPLGESLQRLAAEARAERRRHGEAAARRVPVALLFPLVCCILPAFALLTVAPLIAGALRALAF